MTVPGAGTRRYLASLGGSSLYPRPPFSVAALSLAGAIDSWLDFSNSSVARALAQWHDAGSEKASLFCCADVLQSGWRWLVIECT